MAPSFDVESPHSTVPLRWHGTRAQVSILGFWTLIALLFSLQVHFLAPGANTPWVPGRLVAWQLSGWWSWAVFTPIVFRVSGWLTRLQRPVRIAVAHAAVGEATAVLCASLEGAAKWAFGLYRIPHGLVDGVTDAIAQYWTFNLLVYVMVVGCFYALSYYHEAQERALRTVRLESQLAQARLNVLTAQLQPHFLFNTLHVISALVLEDPRRANRMIARLSELLRHSMRHDPELRVTIEQELELLEHYVAIQETRFGDRLRVLFRIDPSAAGAAVPTLVLQPLVENAIRHGASRDDGITEVCVSARREGARLRLEVRDNGPGFGPGPEREGVGIANTRARLAQLYGGLHGFDLADALDGGAVVTIRIPFSDDVRDHR